MAKRTSKKKITSVAQCGVGDIRLACMHCDREDYDLIKRLPENWQNVVDTSHPSDDDQPGIWWTHLGTCPDCAKREAGKQRRQRCEKLKAAAGLGDATAADLVTTPASGREGRDGCNLHAQPKKRKAVKR